MDTRGGVVAVDNNLFLTYYSFARNCRRGIFEQAAWKITHETSEIMEVYQSGQMGRAVNPLAQPSKVRILALPPFCPHSSAGRALRW